MNISDRIQETSTYNQKILTQNLSCISIPNIFGSKTNLDGVIDNFEQGKVGDCYFLIQLKNLSRKSWGKKIIKDAIQPDDNGGAYVTFKGARSEKRTFHVSVDEIVTNRGTEDKHHYSFGDDDTLVMELAYEKYKKILGYKDINGNTKSDKGSPTKTINHISFKEDDNIIGLICGKNTKLVQAANPYGADLLIQKIKKNFDNYVCEIGFEPNDYGLQTEHAYEIIDITKDSKGHPIIILGNPWDSCEKIRLNYYDAINSVKQLWVWENPDKHLDSFSADDIKYAYMSEDDKKSIDSKQKHYQKLHDKSCGAEEEYIKLSEIIDNYNGDKRIDKLNTYLLKNKNKESLDLMLQEKCSEIITAMDNAEYGWGRGKDKAKLIQPLIDYVGFQARSKNVNLEDIHNFENTCKKELDAIFYTNEKTIIKAFEEIFIKMNKKSSINNTPKPKPKPKQEHKSITITISVNGQKVNRFEDNDCKQ